MHPAVTFGVGVAGSIYLLLRLLLRLTQDEREPPVILTHLPFISPLIGMIREKSQFHVRLRNQYRLPIYTLRLPFQRMYVVNSPDLIPSLQKQWRTVSLSAISADAGYAVGMSKEAVKVMHQDLDSEHSFGNSWPQFILPAMGPGKYLDDINRRAIEVLVDEMGSLDGNKVDERLCLSQWTRQVMVTATSEAIWGPKNPFRDPIVAKAWSMFEAGFLNFVVFPMASTIFPQLLKAREIVVAAFIEYMRSGAYQSASELVRLRYEHHHEQFGFSVEDVARGELGNVFAVLGNSTPCAFWVLYHIFSAQHILSDIRHEFSALVTKEPSKDGTIINSIDLGAIRDSCPILLSTFQETMRFRSVSPGPRVLLEDVTLDSRYLLKKGSMLTIPAKVHHSDATAWGTDVDVFDHMRFVPSRNLAPGQRKPNRVAFRAFGGGHALCPGRHFASTEIMVFAALVVLKFDIVPVKGGGEEKWVEPVCDKSPVQAGFPVPDEDVEVVLHPRDLDHEWKFTFSGSDQAVGIVAEDD